MKKITLLLILFAISFGYSQTLPFDFSTADQAFTHDAAGGTGGAAVINTATEKLEIFGNAQPWDNAYVVFSGTDVVDLSDELNNSISFTVDPLSTTLAVDEERTHRIKLTHTAGVYEVPFTTIGDAEQTILINPGVLGNMTELRIFVDAGVAGPNGDYAIDDIQVVADPGPTCTDGIQNGDETGVDCGGTCPNTCPLPPTTIVAAPARPALDVLSVFGPAYSDVPPSGVQQFAGATFTNYTVATADDTRELTTPTAGGGAQYQYFFGTDTGLDLTNFTTIHLDSWVLNAGGPDSVIRIILQNFDTTTGAFQHNLEATIDVNTPGVETWNTVDIELADFSNPTLARNNIQQIQIVAQGAVFGPTYLTNFYFHKNTVLGADDFSINDLKVSPNPTNDSWNIEGANTTIDSIEVYDILGKRVQILNPNSQQATIDASGLKTGLYLAKLYSGNAVKTIKLVKN